jgi:hypothetical protein
VAQLAAYKPTSKLDSCVASLHHRHISVISHAVLGLTSFTTLAVASIVKVVQLAGSAAGAVATNPALVHKTTAIIQ